MADAAVQFVDGMVKTLEKIQINDAAGSKFVDNLEDGFEQYSEAGAVEEIGTSSLGVRVDALAPQSRGVVAILELHAS